jgi:hypothetical protein
VTPLAGMAALIWAATLINAHNRVAVATRVAPGSYHPVTG